MNTQHHVAQIAAFDRICWHDARLQSVAMSLDVDAGTSQFVVSVSAIRSPAQRARRTVELVINEITSFALTGSASALLLNGAAGNVSDGRAAIELGQIVVRFFLADGYLQVACGSMVVNDSD